MSVLIKDMEKPKYCYAVIDGESEYCPFVNTDDDCVILLKKGICEWTWEEQYSKCPLVEEPKRLTDDDFETIRIHLNAQKEKLCNQRRWEEAEEYQRIIDRFIAFASAQPDLLDDGTLMMTVPNGMLNDVKRVLVDEVGTKFCKVMYQDEPERKNGEWIDYTEDGFVECPFCHSATNCDGNKDELRFCFSCGAELR